VECGGSRSKVLFTAGPTTQSMVPLLIHSTTSRARFTQFVSRPDVEPFVAWNDMRVDVGNNRHAVLFSDGNYESYYSSWQVLVAAEVADMGVHSVSISPNRKPIAARRWLSIKDKGPAILRVTISCRCMRCVVFESTPAHSMRSFGTRKNPIALLRISSRIPVAGGSALLMCRISVSIKPARTRRCRPVRALRSRSMT